MRKTSFKSLAVLTLAFVCTLSVYASSGNKVQADAVKTQQGVSMKSVSLVSNKYIKVPNKTTTAKTVKTGNTANLSRGQASDGFSGTYSAGGGSATQSAVVSFAFAQIGKPYVWGASGPNSFDCSGLAMYVYAHFGIYLPHYTGSQFGCGRSVSKGSLLPGDLVFFNTYGSVSHVGIYIGGGNFIHAPGTGRSVTVSSLYDGYYMRAYCGARRLVN